MPFPFHVLLTNQLINIYLSYLSEFIDLIVFMDFIENFLENLLGNFVFFKKFLKIHKKILAEYYAIVYIVC